MNFVAKKPMRRSVTFLARKPTGQIPLGLPRYRKIILYSIAAGIWSSGLLWLIFRTYMQQESDFGVTPHPLEHWWRILHGAFGFASIWMFGELWGVHIAKGWSRHWRRWSGGTLAAGVIVLILSGLGLYYVENQEVLSLVGTIHWSIGLAVLVAFGIHWFSKSGPRRPKKPTHV
jgi:hypothetical protein